MAIHYIPKNAGQVRVAASKIGTPLVLNGLTGKNKILIACKTWEQAEEVAKKINTGDHNGTVNAGP
jgi:hypothetical protein